MPFIALSAIRGVGRTAHRHVVSSEVPFESGLRGTDRAPDQITRIMTRLASVRRTLDQTFNLIIRLPPIETQDAVFQGQSVDWSMEDAATGTRRVSTACRARGISELTGLPPRASIRRIPSWRSPSSSDSSRATRPPSQTSSGVPVTVPDGVTPDQSPWARASLRPACISSYV